MVTNHVLQELSAKVNSSEREKLLGPVPSLERCEIALMRPGMIGLDKVKPLTAKQGFEPPMERQNNQ
ncbi:MAG: hypothetical protein K0R61_3483 [Microvirga sp.]|jgi:hypothetical protein|nr:hypothetical protein [Microvirga sp.]